MNRIDYRLEIAAALKRELGGSHRTIKTIMKWTGASERTAKNWVSGGHGPAGEHLIELMRHSDEIMKTVLGLSARHDICLSMELTCVRAALVQMLSTADGLMELDTGAN